MALVFARTKHGSERLMKALVKAGFAAGSIHGNKSQGQRDRAIASFKTGELTVLVATDVAARGLDIPGVRHVYNYDLPNVPDNYVHRIGRTARAGATGRAVAFCSPEELKELRDIEKTIKKAIPVIGGRAPETPQGQKPGSGRRGGKPGGAGAGKPNSSKRRRRPNRGGASSRAA